MRCPEAARDVVPVARNDERAGRWTTGLTGSKGGRAERWDARQG